MSKYKKLTKIYEKIPDIECKGLCYETCTLIPAAKAEIARNKLKKGNYTIARMFDDHAGNLDAFLGLKKEFGNINFEAFFVHENGNITRYS